MLEENNTKLEEKSEETSLVEKPVDLLQKIDEATTSQDIKDLTSLFNVSIAKGEMSRALKQSELLNLVLKQASERLEKRPDELSTKDLLDYMNAFQANINKAGSIVEKVNENPTIQVSNHKDVVINVGELSRDSKENVIDFIKEVLKSANSQQDIVEMSKSIQKVEGDDKHDL